MKIPSMKVPPSLDKILHNKFVLYGCIILSVASLLRFLINGNMNALISFVILGGLMTFVSKNLIIILVIPLIIINILFIKKNIFEGITTLPIVGKVDNGVDGNNNPSFTETTQNDCNNFIIVSYTIESKMAGLKMINSVIVKDQNGNILGGIINGGIQDMINVKCTSSSTPSPTDPSPTDPSPTDAPTSITDNCGNTYDSNSTPPTCTASTDNCGNSIWTDDNGNIYSAGAAAAPDCSS